MKRCGHWSTHTILVLSFILSLAIGCGAPSDRGAGKAPNAADDSKATADGELPVLGQVPAFLLTDQDDQPFAKDQLDGHLWIATWIFTRCGNTCPIQTAEFKALQDELRQSNDLGDVQLVTFTVDPEFDTPDVLKGYGVDAKADFDHWHFLTGPRGDLWDLSADGFQLEIKSDRDAESLFAHSEFLILVDRESRIRGLYPATSPTAKQQLREDLQWLLNQQADDGKFVDVSVPTDIRRPYWLAKRAEDQREAAKAYDVRCDFQFVDQIDSSKISFVDKVVEDVTKNFQSAHYDHGSGVAVADVDNDGLLDIYFVCQLGPNELWTNQGDGTFVNSTSAAGVAMPTEVGVAAAFADIDNDGDADLYVTRVRAPNKLFLNDGTGKFQDVSQQSGLDHVGHSSGSVFFDYDHDGLLDLLLTNVGKYTTDERAPSGFFRANPTAFTGHLHPERHEENILFRNLGQGRFRNVNADVGFHDVSWSGDATPIDINEDGWQDIYLLNMQGHDEYYENQQGRRFVKKSREIFPQTPWGAMGVKVFDFNRDGRLDLFVTDMHTDMLDDLDPEEEKSKIERNLPIDVLATDGNHVLGNAFFRNDGNQRFTEISDQIGAENYWPWGISVADLNADGYEDVFIAASMSHPFRYGINSVLLNDRGRTFLDSEFVLGVEPRSKGTAQPWMVLDCSGADIDHPLCAGHGEVPVRIWSAIGTRSSAIFDLDNDGDLDIVTNDFGGTPMVLTSNLQAQGGLNYLKISLQGTTSNRDGLGAQVTVFADQLQSLTAHDGKSGYLSQSRMPLYFGLGNVAQVDRIEIVWPSQTVQVIAGPIAANQLLTIVEEVTEGT